MHRPSTGVLLRRTRRTPAVPPIAVVGLVRDVTVHVVVGPLTTTIKGATTEPTPSVLTTGAPHPRPREATLRRVARLQTDVTSEALPTKIAKIRLRSRRLLRNEEATDATTTIGVLALEGGLPSVTPTTRA